MPVCQQCNQEFTIYLEDKEFYRNIGVPLPKLCPDCRFQLITAYRNERTLYERKCDLCGKPTITMYSPDKPFKIYCRECWWSDKWSALNYGREFDFDQPFFPQFAALRKQVPRIALLNDADSINSAYTNHVYRLKNCYLLSDACDNEDCLYGNGIYLSKDLVDCSYVTETSELCYETLFSQKSYGLKYCRDCNNCRDSAFLLDCRGCNNCFMCVGLRTKSYCIKNKDFGKEGYEQEIKKYNLSKRSNVQKCEKEFYDFALTIPRKYLHGNKNENSDGDYLQNNKSVHHCFQTRNSEQCSYCFGMDESKNCYDVMVYGEQAEVVYQSQACGGQIYKILFGNVIWHGQENFYCDNCLNGAQYNFGSISLKKHKYCILNKEYNENEFMKMREKIIIHMKKTGEWGNYFPKELALFCYNESDAQGFFPLTKQQALKLGFEWQDNMPGQFTKETVAEIPDDINQVSDDVCKEMLKCANCRRNFKILKNEFDYYKKLQIPVPDKCPDCRYRQRLKLRPNFKLYRRQCMRPGCNNIFKTSYAPNRPEIIYCEKCYNKEIY